MEELYKNPKSISGLTEFYKKTKQQDKNITLKNVKEFLKNNIHHKFITHYQLDICIFSQ